MSALAFVRNQTLIDLPEVVFIGLIIVYVFVVTIVGWTAVSDTVHTHTITQQHLHALQQLLSVSCISLCRLSLTISDLV